jgi:hypothetical protein
MISCVMRLNPSVAEFHHPNSWEQPHERAVRTRVRPEGLSADDLAGQNVNPAVAIASATWHLKEAGARLAGPVRGAPAILHGEVRP